MADHTQPPPNNAGMQRDYPKRTSKVRVTFTDGEVKEYTINAGSSLSVYLAQQIASTGILLLLAGAKTYSIPVNQIREYEIEEIS